MQIYKEYFPTTFVFLNKNKHPLFPAGGAMNSDGFIKMLSFNFLKTEQFFLKTGMDHQLPDILKIRANIKI